MPRKRPPFVEVWRDRHGKVRVYFRKERGPRLPLPDSIGSDEFKVAYHAALTGQIDPPRQRHVRAAPGSIGALIISYMRVRPTAAFGRHRRPATARALRCCAPNTGTAVS
jgi:enterobacteria phage integrase